MRALLLCLLLAGAARAEEAARPRNNNSYVPADNEAVASLVLEATRAAEAGNAAAAADRLHALLLTPERGLVALRDRLLFVSPRRWAQIQLLGETEPFGRAVLDAWRAVHGAEADASLAAAIAHGDEEEVPALLARYPAAETAPVALLALFDRAVLRGDTDAARGLLLRLPEHLPRSAEAGFLGTEAIRARRAHLDALAPRPAPGWPTAGGDMARSRRGDPLPPPEELELLWEGPLLEEVPPTLAYGEADATREASPLLPFAATCDRAHVYVHLATCVAVLARGTGKLLFYAPEGSTPDEPLLDEELARGPAVRAATAVDGVLYFERALFDDEVPRRANALVAFDVATRRTLWQVRHDPRRRHGNVLDSPLHFRGAPAVAGDRLYACAAVRDVGDDGPTRKEESHLLCLDRRDGALLWHRFLGYGDTDASPAFPPVSGVAPALSAGVVVCVTGLGVAAALDAATGDVLWLFRYDRKPVRERERLADALEEQKVHRDSGWMGEPPRILGDTVYFAPADSEELYACWLRGARQPGRPLEIEQWSKDRARGHRHSLLEYVAGFAGGRILYVGRRDPRPSLTVSYRAVVSHPLDRDVDLAYGLLPHALRDPRLGAVPPEVYGQPAVAGDVLLVPTREALYRFDGGGDPLSTLREGERHTEIPVLPPYPAPARAGVEGEEVPAAFGNLVAVDGLLYAVTGDRVLCYGKKRP